MSAVDWIERDVAQFQRGSKDKGNTSVRMRPVVISSGFTGPRLLRENGRFEATLPEPTKTEEELQEALLAYTLPRVPPPMHIRLVTSFVGALANPLRFVTRRT